MKQLSRDIANSIRRDLNNRSGMDVFGDTPMDIQAEIIDKWAELVEETLTYYGVNFDDAKGAE